MKILAVLTGGGDIDSLYQVSLVIYVELHLEFYLIKCDGFSCRGSDDFDGHLVTRFLPLPPWDTIRCRRSCIP